MWHVLNVYDISVTQIFPRLPETPTIYCLNKYEMKHHHRPHQADVSMGPSAHLGDLLLPSPLEPFHIIDLINLNLKRLLQHS